MVDSGLPGKPTNQKYAAWRLEEFYSDKIKEFFIKYGAVFRLHQKTNGIW